MTIQVNLAKKLDSIVPPVTSHLLKWVGNTPLVELTQLQPPNGDWVFVKLEGCNPGGGAVTD